MEEITAAGIYIIRNINNVPEALGLIALKKERKRVGGTYDFPKGSVEAGENTLDAAFRECFEESGLKPKLITKDPIVFNRLAIWVGITDDDTVTIKENPESGLLEHEGHEWIRISEMKKKCLSYLRLHAIECEKTIWEYFKI